MNLHPICTKWARYNIMHLHIFFILSCKNTSRRYLTAGYRHFLDYKHNLANGLQSFFIVQEKDPDNHCSLILKSNRCVCMIQM